MIMATGPHDTDFEPDESLALARIEIQNNQHAVALARLKALTQGDHADPQAGLVLARLYGQLGLPARAQAGFEAFLLNQPDAVHERFELGVALMEQGKPDAALQTWAQVLRQAPTYPPALYFTAVAHYQLSQSQEAEQVLRTLFQTSAPDNTYHERGRELLQQRLQISSQRDGAPFAPLPVVQAQPSPSPQASDVLPENFGPADQYLYKAK